MSKGNIPWILVAIAGGIAVYFFTKNQQLDEAVRTLAADNEELAGTVDAKTANIDELIKQIANTKAKRDKMSKMYNG